MSASQQSETADVELFNADLQEALRLSQWLAGVEEEMLRLILPDPAPVFTTVAQQVHLLIKAGELEAARTKAAHLPHVDRQILEERRTSIQLKLGEVMLANFESMAAAYIRLHTLLGTTAPDL